jgi:hypothetical protein
MAELPVYRRKTRKVLAVRWTGELKDLPKVFRAHKNASTFMGRIEITGKLTVLRRGNVTSGIRPGDWLLRDEEGRLEVMSDERFHLEYMCEGEDGAA